MATGKEAIIAKALLARLAGQSYSGMAYAMPDVPFDPETISSYLEVEFHTNDHGVQSLENDGLVQKQGFLMVKVVVKKGGGAIKPLDVAGAIVSNWAKGTQILGDDGTLVRISRRPNVATAVEDDVRTSYPVVIPWQVLDNA